MIKKILFLLLFSNISYQVSAQDLEEPNLYVFVGEKISVERFSPDLEEGQILMDAAFKARYKIIKHVYNELESDTIEFEAYDHYGTPAFSKFEHVLLYVVKTEKGFYHSKYQFTPLYKTKNNTWAGPYQVGDYNHPYNTDTSIEAKKVEWSSPPKLKPRSTHPDDLNRWYPEPYYELEGDSVVAVHGNSLQELFELKKTGVLKARGYFN